MYSGVDPVIGSIIKLTLILDPADYDALLVRTEIVPFSFDLFPALVALSLPLLIVVILIPGHAGSEAVTQHTAAPERVNLSADGQCPCDDGLILEVIIVISTLYPALGKLCSQLLNKDAILGKDVPGLSHMDHAGITIMSREMIPLATDLQPLIICQLTAGLHILTGLILLAVVDLLYPACLLLIGTVTSHVITVGGLALHQHHAATHIEVIHPAGICLAVLVVIILAAEQCPAVLYTLFALDHAVCVKGIESVIQLPFRVGHATVLIKIVLRFSYLELFPIYCVMGLGVYIIESSLDLIPALSYLLSGLFEDPWSLFHPY